MLQPKEQDTLGAVLSNLEIAALVYDSDLLDSRRARNMIVLIDAAIAVMEAHGLLHAEVKKPLKFLRR